MFQPAVYVFCLDVSRSAVETGYLKVFCDVLLEELEKLPGDSRTHIGFLTYDRVVHFYSLPDGATQPTQLTVCDIDGKFKGQLISKCPYEKSVLSKIPTKKFPSFLP